jgi:hypothetical protein
MIKTFLRACINVEMRDSGAQLPMAELLNNDSRTADSGPSPIYANYSFYPNSGVTPAM